MASAGTAYVDVEARTDDVASAIESALSSVDGTVEAVVEADVSTAQSEIDSLESSPVDVPVDADVDTAQAEIDGIDGGQAEVAVTADTSQAQSSIDDLSGSIGALGDVAGVGGAGGALGGLTDSLTELAGASGGAAAAVGLAVGALGMSVSAAADAQVVTAETESILGSLGDTAVVTGDHIAELSQRVMEYSGFSDEAVQAGANTLLMFDNIRSAEVFDRAIEGAADLARRMNTDVPNAARLLGMALQDPEAGMARLRRAGITLSDAQKDQVASFMAVGDTAAAQEVILESLEDRIGNLAEDYGETLSGGVDRAKESMDELAESTGQALLPAMESLTDVAGPLSDWIEQFHEVTGNLAMGPLTSITGTIEGIGGAGITAGPKMADFSNALGSTGDAADDAAGSIANLSDEIDNYLSGLYDVEDAQQAQRQSFADLAEAMATGTWDEQADAMQDVVESFGDLIQAQVQAGDSEKEMTKSAIISINNLRAMEAQGLLTADQVDDLTSRILDMPGVSVTKYMQPGLASGREQTALFKTQVDTFPKGASTVFTAPGLSDSRWQASSYKGLVDGLDGRVVTTTYKTIGSPVGKAFASGTESAPAGLALVGEEGPELVVFGGGERVFPAGQTKSMLAAGGTGQAAGASIVVNVHGSATAADGQAVVDALRRWSQHNGPVPVKVSA